MKKILFICIGNINRSRSAEAIFNAIAKQYNMKAFSRGLIQSTEGKPISPEMYSLLSDTEKLNVSKEAQELSVSDLNEADIIFVMDYYILDLLRTRFGSIYWENKTFLYTQFSSTIEPYYPIEDPYSTKDFVRTYNELKKYMDGIIKGLKSLWKLC